MRLPSPEEYLSDLKGRLTAEKISNTELGNEMGIHASAVSRHLTGKVEPRLSTINKIEAAVAAILAKRIAE